MLLIEHVQVYTPNERLDNVTLVIEAGHISAIGSSQMSMPAAVTRIDGSGLTAVPGFIDLQLNGAFGDDFTSHPETIWRVAAVLPRFGVTSFLPTIITSPLSHIAQAQHVLQNPPANFRGAAPLGLHLEGPFLNPQKKGAHNPIYLRPPDVQVAKEWSPVNGVRLVTLAPELPHALQVVAQLTANGVIVSAGHTMATVDEADAGWDAGIRYATHLPNAMPPLEHRAPGVAGAVLAHQTWTTGIIPDGIHVHPTLIHAVWHAKGPAQLNVVSDAMAALGMPPGRYQLNDFDVIVTDRDARLADGTLAGSILPLDQAVRNLIAFTGCSLADALATVTTTPARLLHLEAERGHIAPGMCADIVLLDADLQVRKTIAAGEIVYGA